MKRPKGPVFNSHDRQVVATASEMVEEVRRTGMNLIHVGPSGLVVVDGDCYPDLTVGLFHDGALRLTVVDGDCYPDLTVGLLHVGPSGLTVVDGDCYPDLTVGAITCRPFGPHCC